jgi:hypothetical protein
MTDDERCIRCQRPALRGLWDPSAAPDDPSFDDPEFSVWETTPDGLICPGCLTHEEKIDMAEDMLDVERRARGEES